MSSSKLVLKNNIEHEPSIIVGHISGIYGVRGWLKLYSYTRPKENIFTYSPLLIKGGHGWQRLDIEANQHHGQKLFVKIHGIDSPVDAHKFIQCGVAIAHSQLPPLNEGEYYWHELIDLDVLNQDGVKIGKIIEIIETGANDVLVVKAEGKHKILIPLIMELYVKQVDLLTKTIHVDWQIDIPT